jgi:hypothetical protein
MRTTNTYDILLNKTAGSSFVGTDFWVESTWNQISAMDHIENNNSENAKGVNMVSGSIKHKLRVPGFGGAIYQSTQLASNSHTWIPK